MHSHAAALSTQQTPLTRPCRAFSCSVGFHRRLVTFVEASWPHGGATVGCTLALLEALPAGAYADAYELSGLERAGGAWLRLRSAAHRKHALKCACVLGPQRRRRACSAL
jgi:hypothetical protein